MPEEELEGQGETTGEVTQGQEETPGTGINPAWNDLLEVLPSQLQPLVTPHLQQWDKNYQEGVQKVHSEYEPYKSFKEQEIPAEQLQYGLQLLDAMENRPQEVYAAMQEFFKGQETEQQPPVAEVKPGEQGQESTPEIDITSHPQFKQLTEIVNALVEQTVQQTQAEQNAQADAELEAELKAATEKHGEFDADWVISKVMASDFKLTIDQAAEQYREFEKSILAKANQPGPKVLSAGGSTPNSGVKPSQLDEKGRVSLIADMLKNSAAQNG